MKIAVDAMGGDYAPLEVVLGAIDACREYGAEVILVGIESEIKAILDKHNISGLKIEICHASEVIAMGEHPAVAVKSKKDSSLVVANQLVKKGEAAAVYSAGSTGAAMASSLLHLGRVSGIKRPAIASPLPNFGGGVTVLLDSGANADCDPENLLQFAVMGSLYSEKVFNVAKPRVGLVSIGEEETKGNKLTLETHALLKNSKLNFIGNVEGRDALSGCCDVLVCDGFTGNVMLKMAEGLSSSLFGQIKTKMTADPLALLGGMLLKSKFREIKKQLDHTEHGGAPLLGLKGISMIGHGSSNAKAVKNAIRASINAVNGGIVERISEYVKENEQ